MVVVMLVSIVAGCGAKKETPEQETPVQAETTQAATPEPTPKAPEKTYVLKFNHVLAESEPYHKAFKLWAERVNERTNGGLQIEVFPSAQLGVEEDIIEQLKQGANVGQNTDSARLGMYVPEIAVMNAPYFVDSIEEVEKLKELPRLNSGRNVWEKSLA